MTVERLIRIITGSFMYVWTSMPIKSMLDLFMSVSDPVNEWVTASLFYGTGCFSATSSILTINFKTIKWQEPQLLCR